MNDNDDSDDSQDSGSEASSRGALLQAKGGSKHDGRGGKSKRKAKKMPMVWLQQLFLLSKYILLNT